MSAKSVGHKSSGNECLNHTLTKHWNSVNQVWNRNLNRYNFQCNKTQLTIKQSNRQRLQEAESCLLLLLFLTHLVQVLPLKLCQLAKEGDHSTVNGFCLPLHHCSCLATHSCFWGAFCPFLWIDPHEESLGKRRFMGKKTKTWKVYINVHLHGLLQLREGEKNNNFESKAPWQRREKGIYRCMSSNVAQAGSWYSMLKT